MAQNFEEILRKYFGNLALPVSENQYQERESSREGKAEGFLFREFFSR
jgi:hypothetical protein